MNLFFIKTTKNQFEDIITYRQISVNPFANKKQGLTNRSSLVLYKYKIGIEHTAIFKDGFNAAKQWEVSPTKYHFYKSKKNLFQPQYNGLYNQLA